MPRRDDYNTEREAMAIVRGEEVARGWVPGPALSKKQEAIEGCDFLSTPPDGGPAHPVEVKGWGESLFVPTGAFRYAQDINVEQLERARRDPNWRLEIVANLGNARQGLGAVERLTLTAADLEDRVRPWKYRVNLSDFVERARVIPVDTPPVTGSGGSVMTGLDGVRHCQLFRRAASHSMVEKLVL